jgi:hypothetical protein
MTDEKITTNANDRPGPARREEPRQAGTQLQGEADQAHQQTSPVRRPLFRTSGPPNPATRFPGRDRT